MPSPLQSPFLSLEGTRTQGRHAWSGLALAAFERRPLVLHLDDGGEEPIVGSRFGVDLAMGYGLRDAVDLGVVLPMVLNQRGRQPDGETPVSSFAIGDPGVGLRVGVLSPEQDGLGLAFSAFGTVPFGESAAFAGETGFSLWLRAAVERPLDARTDVGVNAGYHARPSSRIGNVRIDDELAAAGGVSHRLTPGLAVVAELTLATRAGAPFDQLAETPVDANFGGRWRVFDQWELVGGLGAGLHAGYGSPQWRGIIGVAYGPRRQDFDGDRVVDGRDRCILEPGSAAAHGCPAVASAERVERETPNDRDHDGLPDDRDRCPGHAEDVDGFLDDDGCPDDDNDLDFMADGGDGDALAPEDWDSFQDEDGVPELDNDSDGVADYRDKCPNLAGGADGCPGANEPGRRDIVNVAGPDAPLLLGDTLHPARPIRFAPNAPELTAEDRALLIGLAELLKANPKLGRAEIGVHEDPRIGGRGPQLLSNERAASVWSALVEMGVPASRLVPRGYGGSVPVATGNTVESMARNQRVELRLLDARPPPSPTPAEGKRRAKLATNGQAP